MKKYARHLRLLGHVKFNADYIVIGTVYMIAIDIKLQALYNLAYDCLEMKQSGAWHHKGRN